ncbi:MAG: phosphoribosylaminoimidazolesuccinocarboxamide synthase [Deltaproteobacteria bacterium]|jgi:phosphoribosylaminoimidazole-succinocarboxamide synthase|nr:phosphoribosylaminoimidazolesuccinocarboxamide synthase [Deltaproteobacteria bacterium]
MQIVTELKIDEFSLFSQGKVRDIYELDGSALLIATTDRMSAFDVIMNEPVPYKGVVLNQITIFWMERFKNLVPNHLLSVDIADFPAELLPYAAVLSGRAVLARKAKPLPVECIVRGYLAGSAWAEYQQSGTICGQILPEGLLESSRLPMPVFTPSTKASIGQHDENITDIQAINLIGEDVFARVKSLSVKLFTEASKYAASRGIIIADTKFEFGLVQGTLVLIDEVLTPDSSRFWPLEGYAPGKGQPSFDKQYLRDWLSAQPWDKTPPPPALPAQVIDETARKYREAYTLLTGKELQIAE